MSDDKGKIEISKEAIELEDAARQHKARLPQAQASSALGLLGGPMPPIEDPYLKLTKDQAVKASIACGLLGMIERTMSGSIHFGMNAGEEVDHAKKRAAEYRRKIARALELCEEIEKL